MRPFSVKPDRVAGDPGQNAHQNDPFAPGNANADPFAPGNQAADRRQSVPQTGQETIVVPRQVQGQQPIKSQRPPQRKHIGSSEGVVQTRPRQAQPQRQASPRRQAQQQRQVQSAQRQQGLQSNADRPKNSQAKPQSTSAMARPKQNIKLRQKGNEVMAIITDERNGKEYYVALMDSFIYGGREYSVMYNYEPDSSEHVDPEIVIMRTYRDTNGDQYFTSVRDKTEMSIVFEIFYERYIRSMKK